MNRQLRGVLSAFGVVAVLVVGFLVAKSSRHNALLAPLPTIALDQFKPTPRKIVSEALENVKKEPLRADRWGELGYALAGNGAFNEAGACFARAEKLEPDNYRWPHLFAFATIKFDRKPAIDALKRALDLHPNVVPTLGLLAESYLEDGNDKDAEALLRPRVTDKTDDQRLLFEMARIEVNAGAVDKAIALAERAAATPPRRRQIHQLLAQLYQRKGDVNLAKKQARILELIPSSNENSIWPDAIAAQAMKYARDIDTMAIQARQLASQGSSDEAIRSLEQMSAEERSSPSIASALAIVKAQTGDFKAAEELLSAVPFKDDPNIIFAMGYVASVQKKYEEAAAQYGRLTAATQGAGRSRFADGAFVNQGICYLGLKKESEAIAAFEQALKLNPGNIDAMEQLAKLYLQKNRKGDAKRILEDAALLEPKDESIKQLQKLASK